MFMFISTTTFWIQGVIMTSNSNEIAPRITAYAYDDMMLLHKDPEDDHPEQPARLTGILECLKEAELLQRCLFIPTADLSSEALGAVHTLEHRQFISSLRQQDEETLKNKSQQMDSIYLCQNSEISANVAAACTLQLAVAIGKGIARNGFALVRPPGHHAEPDRAMGFCLFNNVAIAVQELKRQGLAKKILIFDWDIHHGNGTLKIFASDPDVLFISIHRYDDGKFYPGESDFASPKYVGEAPAQGKSVNIGWNGTALGDADYFYAFMQVVLPVAEEFQPDIIVVSAGFDAAEGDPIGLCSVTPQGFARMTQMLMNLAGGKVLLVLEGGYNVPVVADCSAACMRALLGDPLPLKDDVPMAGPSLVASEAIFATLKAQRPFWKALRPRCYNFDQIPESISLQDVYDIFWRQICVKVFNMIPMPMADDKVTKSFNQNVYISDNLLDSPSAIVIFAHESGAVLSENSIESNLIDMNKTKIYNPFEGYLAGIQGIVSDVAIVNVSTPSRRWQLKQTHAGAPDELLALNELFLYIWDYFLALSNCQNIYFVTSGLAAYSICNLIDKRVIKYKVKGVAVISPTLYLPIASTEKAAWYQRNSLVIIPTKKLEGTGIPTNPSFGSCISSGCEDPQEIPLVIHKNKARIFSFIKERYSSTINNEQ